MAIGLKRLVQIWHDIAGNIDPSAMDAQLHIAICFPSSSELFDDLFCFQLPQDLSHHLYTKHHVYILRSQGWLESGAQLVRYTKFGYDSQPLLAVKSIHLINSRAKLFSLSTLPPIGKTAVTVSCRVVYRMALIAHSSSTAVSPLSIQVSWYDLVCMHQSDNTVQDLRLFTRNTKIGDSLFWDSLATNLVGKNLDQTNKLARFVKFCQVNHGVSFPLMKKSDVNGDDANEVYKYLKAQKSGILGLTRIKWNFEKFLIDRQGNVVGRWASTTKPESLEADIEKLL
ncbi:GSHPx domain-containing protein [Rhizoctonia solani AG-1 IA]|uniref:GSHPx domain-containing protein n=1 Tax=Thanatephorus cucumeris (strain AG1-IA) TaxID=983506 RepID=L8WVA6_THACA|nr:GSHPx domain-containing protein [Rhizoctonia solani AG-1 IA]